MAVSLSHWMSGIVLETEVSLNNKASHWVVLVAHSAHFVILTNPR
jgi:hypothetical protein